MSAAVGHAVANTSLTAFHSCRVAGFVIPAATRSNGTRSYTIASNALCVPAVAGTHEKLSIFPTDHFKVHLFDDKAAIAFADFILSI